MEDYIGILVFIAIVIFNFGAAILSSRKNKKKKLKGGRNKQVARRARTAKKTSKAEAIWEDLVQQAKEQIEQKKAGKPKHKALPTPYQEQDDNIFSYDDEFEQGTQKKQFSYDNEYKETHQDEPFSYDDKYEAEGYQERRQAELERMIDKRHHGEHLKSTTRSKIKAAKIDAFSQIKKPKNKNKKKFKFNSKDAIIYDVIMNRKYK